MADQQQYKCPCCGGALEFNSSIQKIKCPYCDTEFEMDALKECDSCLSDGEPDEINWQSVPGAEWTADEAGKMRLYVCKSCGGEIIGDENMGATRCPFCDNPVIIMGQFAEEMKPDLVIPFKLDREAAKRNLEKHLMKKLFLPKVFKDQNHIDEIKGIYVPFWIFDAESKARINYSAQKVRTWSDSRYIYTETSHFRCFRAGSLDFEHIPVDGSEKMADDLMESIEPFDFSEAVDFKTAYLAGYLADKYDVSREDSAVRANRRVKASTENAFYSTVKGFSNVRTLNSSVKIDNGRCSYALYPVWILNTTWKGQKYTFAMNGQTGKFVGNLPCDKKILHKYLWSITFIGTAILTGVAYLLWLL